MILLRRAFHPQRSDWGPAMHSVGITSNLGARWKLRFGPNPSIKTYMSGKPQSLFEAEREYPGQQVKRTQLMKEGSLVSAVFTVKIRRQIAFCRRMHIYKLAGKSDMCCRGKDHNLRTICRTDQGKERADVWQFSEVSERISLTDRQSETQTGVRFSRQVLIFKTFCFTFRNSYLLQQPDFGVTLCI